MSRKAIITSALALLLLWTGNGMAQVAPLAPNLLAANLAATDAGAPAVPFNPAQPAFDLPPSPPPRMAPELALETYEQRAQRQLADLGAYSDTTVVEADLPATLQHGKFELKRSFLAPKSLAFQALRFVGDSFVKNNVIVRLLQSEVTHVQKGEGVHTAIVAANYKFSFKGTDSIGGREVYVFQVKPREKRPGLFKGRIYVDAYSGSLCRAEGVMVKSPSFFVKKIEFVQDYTQIDGFSLPAQTHSVASTRLVGRAVVDIVHTGYQARSVQAMQTAPAGPSQAALVPGGSN
jgi:hypothetical protein